MEKASNSLSLDSASNSLDFRNPENFFHDVNSVAGLLKQFFRDLPDPLLTREHYGAFIEAASKFLLHRHAVFLPLSLLYITALYYLLCNEYLTHVIVT